MVSSEKCERPYIISLAHESFREDSRFRRIMIPVLWFSAFGRIPLIQKRGGEKTLRRKLVAAGDDQPTKTLGILMTNSLLPSMGWAQNPALAWSSQSAEKEAAGLDSNV
jgi:hypothetical protein